MEELMLNMETILVTQGEIVFKEFEPLKEQALELAGHIGQIEVNDENLKTSKKLLAAVNKKIKELEDRRIKIKRLMLEPYQTFEDQVKEIVSIVKNADDTVRQQVKQLEEMERNSKEKMIEEIFDKRIKHYSFRNLFNFHDFFHSKHLNKTVSIKQVEDEMIMFLEKISKDISVIEKMPNATPILNHYYDVKDLTAAIELFNLENERKMKIEQAMASMHKPLIKEFHITLFNEKDLTMLEMFMKQNKIKYSVLELEGRK